MARISTEINISKEPHEVGFFSGKKFLAISLITLIFIGCTTKAIPEPQNPITIKAIIVPHHLLVENYIDDFYKQISEKNPNVEKIILISPNHFDYGNRYIQSTTSLTDKDGTRINIDKNEIAKLSQTEAFSIEPIYFEKEHGIMNELIFTNKYFPNAEIIPIRIKNGTTKNHLDKLTNELSKIITPNTLIIISTDFTHYTNEKIALENDQKFIKYFENLNETKEINFDEIKKLAQSSKIDSPDAVADDSPESLYAALKLIQKENALVFTFFKRTSSASLLALPNPLDNTSHLFGEFSK
ncbi:MAG: AmmeMemoRadiSam system protein B [Candidatus Peregrinibacteria bacterium]|nr:AmmeMemoRadiSam system protein B [Candidatus Peregrinibacteria bacterium]